MENFFSSLSLIIYNSMFDKLLLTVAKISSFFSGSCSKCKQTAVTPRDGSRFNESLNCVCQRPSHVANQASNVIHFLIMHNITSVFLLCKLFLLCRDFPFLVLGYLGELQPVGRLPVGDEVNSVNTANTHANTSPEASQLGYIFSTWVANNSAKQFLKKCGSEEED